MTLFSSIVLFSVSVLIALRLEWEFRRRSAARPAASPKFVEGGHYLVWYTTEDGHKNRGYLIIDRVSEDGKSILRRLGVRQTEESCREPSWMGVVAYDIESVIRSPEPQEIGDTRGSYRG